jgi:hypothetical protein
MKKVLLIGLFMILFLGRPWGGMNATYNSQTWDPILQQVKSGNMHLSVTVSKEIMPNLPNALSERELITWLSNGWLEPETFIATPQQLKIAEKRCHWEYHDRGDHWYEIHCEPGSGARPCHCEIPDAY